MPFMAPSGIHWRCWIGSVKFFYRNHGAILCEVMPSSDDEVQERASIARYTSGQTNEYFGWKDAQTDDVRSLADKFLNRFRLVADSGQGWDYPYAGWYQRLLGLAEGGWLPVVLSDYSDVSYDRILMTFDQESGTSTRRRCRSCRYPLPGSYSRTTEVSRGSTMPGSSNSKLNQPDLRSGPHPAPLLGNSRARSAIS
jgi:hypothetical protein